MKQTYFKQPKYSKNYIVQKPSNLYEEFVNAYEIIITNNEKPSKKELQERAQNSWREIKMKDTDFIRNHIFELLQTPIPSSLNFFPQQKSAKNLPKPLSEPSEPPEPPEPEPLEPLELLPMLTLPQNATVQKQLHEKLQKNKADLYEYNNLLRAATSSEIRSQFTSKIKKLEDTIVLEEKKLKRLKGNAEARQRSRNKKREKLYKENIVEVYDTPGRPSFLLNDPELLNKMHNSVEFGAADHKRRKETIKVRTVKHLREEIEENYNIYMAKSTLRNYIQPRHPATKEAQRHHHPAQIRLAAVGRNEMSSHVDEHYCLASVKSVKSFASAFPRDVVLISQDDKAKVPLGVAAVGRTFKAIQTASEPPVSVPDHDFPKAPKHNLIPSVYLMIDPSDTTSLRSGKMRIFVRPEYFLGTNCETHIVDLMSITKEESFNESTHYEGSVKPFWYLLTDGGPDQNPRFLANISKYLLLFKKLDLDYIHFGNI